MYWNLVIKKKKGKNVSAVKLNEGEEAIIVGNEEDGSLREVEEEQQKALDEQENYKHNKKRKYNTILDLHNVESPEETEKEKTNKSKVLKT